MEALKIKKIIREALVTITELREDNKRLIVKNRELEERVKRLEYEKLTLKSDLAEARVKARAKSWFIFN